MYSGGAGILVHHGGGALGIVGNRFDQNNQDIVLGMGDGGDLPGTLISNNLPSTYVGDAVGGTFLTISGVNVSRLDMASNGSSGYGCKYLVDPTTSFAQAEVDILDKYPNYCDDHTRKVMVGMAR